MASVRWQEEHVGVDTPSECCVLSLSELNLGFWVRDLLWRSVRGSGSSDGRVRWTLTAGANTPLTLAHLSSQLSSTLPHQPKAPPKSNTSTQNRQSRQRVRASCALGRARAGMVMRTALDVLLPSLDELVQPSPHDVAHLPQAVHKSRIKSLPDPVARSASLPPVYARAHDRRRPRCVPR